MRKAIFLDRDGTINIDKGYVYRIQDFEFIEKVPEAIAEMKRLGYLVIVLSNQSGVARGYYTEDAVVKLHEYINEQLRKAGTEIDGFYFCPHHPDGIVGRYRQQCGCRKPGIGMLQYAVQDFGIDVGNSWIVGDKERDLFLGYDIFAKRILLEEEWDIPSYDLSEKKYSIRKNLWEFVQKDLWKGGL